MINEGVILGTCISAANGILACAALRWAFFRSTKVFYGVFFGGMIWKLVTLLAVFLFLARYPFPHAASFLVSMALGTFIFNIVELKLLPKLAAKKMPRGF